jgi:predicted RND superfamily exporter protein
MLLITWLVNLIPLLIVAGVMGLVSIDLRISTSLIFSIAFGIAVDDTIHFLTRYKMELRQGRTNLYAIKRSFISTGKAIIMTSIMLCAGFVTLLGSNFMSTYYIGLLVSITLLFAVLIDMTLLPILLMYRKKV